MPGVLLLEDLQRANSDELHDHLQTLWSAPGGGYDPSNILPRVAPPAPPQPTTVDELQSHLDTIMPTATPAPAPTPTPAPVPTPTPTPTAAPMSTTDELATHLNTVTGGTLNLVGQGLTNLQQAAPSVVGQGVTPLQPPTQPVPAAQPSVFPLQQPGALEVTPTTAELSGGGPAARGLTDRGRQIMAGGADIASWLGPEGQKVLQAVLVTEGGMNNARGDQGLSAGPLQFYAGGGQLNEFMRQHGMSQAQAMAYVEGNPLEAVRWAIGTPDRPGYLGQAIANGQRQGLSGADLATYAQRRGQVSVSPERAGANYNALFAGGATALTTAAGLERAGVVEAAAAPAYRDISQFGDAQLTADEAYAACGPAAAVRFAQRFGRNPSLREALDLAKTVGWTQGQGMAGIASEKVLMDRMGVATRLVSGAQWDTFAKEAQTGNPVTISTRGHYFTADGYDPNTGRFHVGRSGLDLRGGKEWMTAAEMTNLMGEVQGALLADNPSVPTTSTVSGPAPSAGTAPLESIEFTAPRTAPPVATTPASAPAPVETPLQVVGNVGAQVLETARDVGQGALRVLDDAVDTVARVGRQVAGVEPQAATPALAAPGMGYEIPRAPAVAPAEGVPLRQDVRDLSIPPQPTVGETVARAAEPVVGAVRTFFESPQTEGPVPQVSRAMEQVGPQIPEMIAHAPVIGGVLGIARGPALLSDEELLSSATPEALERARTVARSITRGEEPTQQDIADQLRASRIGEAVAMSHGGEAPGGIGPRRGGPPRPPPGSPEYMDWLTGRGRWAPPEPPPSPTVLQQINAVRMAGLLSSTVTHIGNAVGNAFNGATVIPQHLIASGIDWGRASITGGARERYLSEIVPMIQAWGPGLLAKVPEAIEILKTGARLDQIGKVENLGTGFPIIRRILGQGPGQVAEAAIEMPLRALQAADVLFRGGAMAAHSNGLVVRQALQEGFSGPALDRRVAYIMGHLDDFPKIRDEAATQAARAVFQETRQIPFIGNPVANQLEKRDVLRFIESQAVPFTRTPYNIAAQGAGLSPLGFVGAGAAALKGQAGLAEDRAARAILGSGVFAIATWMANQRLSDGQRLLTGAYPDDPGKQSTLPNGWREWSMRLPVGDQIYYVPMQTFGPWGWPLAMAAVMADAAQSGKPWTDPKTMAKIAHGMGQYVFDQTFLQGLSDSVNAVQDPGRYAQKWAEQEARSLTPASGMGRQLQTVSGAVNRDPRAGLQGILDAMATSYPGTAETVPERTNALGDPISPTVTGPAAALLPRVTAERDDPTLRVLRNNDVGISPIAKAVNVPSGSVELTESEQAEFKKVRGDLIKRYVAGEVQSGDFAKGSLTARNHYLEQAIQRANTDAKQQMLDKWSADRAAWRGRIQPKKVPEPYVLGG